VALTTLKDWEVNMAECKLQVLFENEKEKNYILLSVFGGSIFVYTEFQYSH
jgi:hypothetical protein